MRKVWKRAMTSALAATMAFSSITMVSAKDVVDVANTILQETLAETTESIDLQWNTEGTNYTQDGTTFQCNSIGKGDSFLLSETKGKDFVYETDVKFNERKGAASLVFRSNGTTDDSKKMYVANINGETGEARLFKFNGQEAVNVEDPVFLTLSDDNTYHLKVVTSDNKITYTVGDATLEATDDMIGEGQFGMLTWEADATYSNVTASSAAVTDLTTGGLDYLNLP